jgi:tryptophan-rich sensory protein
MAFVEECFPLIEVCIPERRGNVKLLCWLSKISELPSSLFVLALVILLIFVVALVKYQFYLMAFIVGKIIEVVAYVVLIIVSKYELLAFRVLNADLHLLRTLGLLEGIIERS